jgi:predicted DNA-binding transcriptional regulator YafY
MPQRKLFNLAGTDIIDTIQKAGRQKRTVTITYMDAKGETSTRETEPYEIKDGAYYGYCLMRQQIRRFNLTNIMSAQMTNTTYNPRWEVKF